MCAQIVEIRVSRSEGRMVASERAARRVCFCLSCSCRSLVLVRELNLGERTLGRKAAIRKAEESTSAMTDDATRAFVP